MKFVCNSVHLKNKWRAIDDHFPFFKAKRLNLTRSYYRFMSEKAFDFIMKGQFRFRNPALWFDPFEKLMVEGDYTQLSYERPATYAACFTRLSNGDAHWKMYNDNEDLCIRVEFDMNNFIGVLALSCVLYIDINLYIGNVSYLEEGDIAGIGSKSGKYHGIAVPDKFSQEDYVDLLLLKRHPFKWEEETRVIVLTDGEQGEYMNLCFSPEIAKTFIKSIEINPKASEKEMERLESKYRSWWEDYPKDNVYDFKCTKSNLYSPMERIVFEK